MRKLALRVHDTHLGIWQDDANDPSFREEIYSELIRQMRARGWSIKADPDIKRHYSILSPNNRLAAKGTLRAIIQLSGRALKVEFWATTWPLDNRNGRRYDFDKFDRMTYLDQKRFALETKRIREWLEGIAKVIFTESDRSRAKRSTALEMIQHNYDESCHSCKTLGRPVCNQDYNRRSRDGLMLEHGQTVWFAGRDGRLRRGKAFYNLNSMWWVVDGKHSRQNLSCREIYAAQPENLRVKRNERQRRARLERELAGAVRTSNYTRAAELHKVLFGKADCYRIWSRKDSAYYRANRSGYTTDAIVAGRYTREEAETEVKRVPHILEMECPDGKRVRFDQEAA